MNRKVINVIIMLFSTTLCWGQGDNTDQTKTTKLNAREFNTQHKQLLTKANASVDSVVDKVATDPLRPVFHLTTAANWINDPNGPIQYKGEYHMFFQHNPYGEKWGNMSWGHAVSKDLVHWKHLPIALTPNPDSYDKDGVFSGCCVVHEGVPTILYTGVHPQTQCVAKSYDDMLTWEKYAGNPVIPERPRDDLEGFRDPFVWKEGNSWYMVIGSGIKGQGGTALLYTSKDLLSWEYLNPLCVGFGINWECPNFFPLGDKHVLVVSPHGDVQYSVGEYKNFRFSPGLWRSIDLGGKEGFYAPNCLLDDKGRRIMWGWIIGGGSDGFPWNGVLTLPRELTLRPDGRLGMKPVEELKQLRGKHVPFGEFVLNPDADFVLPDVQGSCLEIMVEIEPGNAEAFGVKVLCSPDGKEETAITYNNNYQNLSAADKSGDFQLLPNEKNTLLAYLCG